MSSLTIRELAPSVELDRKAMASVRGGMLGPQGGIGQPDISVNVGVAQNIVQVQKVNVGVLNNDGIIGAGFKAPSLDLNLSQPASTNNSFHF